MGYSAKHKLSEDLRSRCPKLFTDFNAQVIEECKYPQAFGNAWTILLIDGLRFRFVADRNTRLMQIRDWRGYGGWKNLDEVVIGITGRDTTFVPLTWEQWCDLFVAHRDQLKKAKNA